MVATDSSQTDQHADSHGHTAAAWTMVTILVLASIVGGVAIVLGNWWLFGIGGGGLVVVGLIVGKAMSVARRNQSA